MRFSRQLTGLPVGLKLYNPIFPAGNLKAADTIADWGLQAKLIVGKPLEVKRFGADVVADIQNFSVTLSCDGDVREQGKGSNALGSPLRAVGHLISVLAKQPHASALQSGEMVTTGTLTAALPIRPGQIWSTNLNGIALSGITVSFEK